jgi:predicted protein tyrosine phosphatase
MIVEIMGREEAQDYSYLQHDEKAAVISILNIDGGFADFRNNPDNGIEAVCRVYFNDVELDKLNCITDADADIIASFVREIADSANKLIVHCEYGVSRSAGIAAAIMKFLTGDDLPIFNNPLYRPNVTCYRKLMAAFHEVIDEHEFREKVAANRNLWDSCY